MTNSLNGWRRKISRILSGINMKLIIELTNGISSVSGDCGCISDLMTGESERSIEYMYNQKIPRYHFEE